ncbi:T9SS type B sorting domain-containing protein [Chishuiella sp.]|uniref:T9SS type B sorting domain-containing protein n=1 Tax=Chishuiella sp. TaxID=1969467 RepID=UPI0028B01E9B|nr:T9SS type B sorting domain-containing protein [Chishuiella sp.]
MNNRFLFFFIFTLFSSLKVYSQLDLEHWFPPFFDSSKSGIEELYIFLSTDKEENFKVNLYKHNVLIKTFNLSKNNPIQYLINDDADLRSSVARNTMKISDMGYHLAGEKSFYASLRISGTISEMISSKGKTALGKEFYVVNDKSIIYDPDEPKGTRKFLMNYQASIIAYQDNTHIKISNYDKRLVFTNGDGSDELNITLNKGDSYIVAAVKSDNVDPDRIHPVIDDTDPNLIGAKITSDKNIIVNNGNILSQSSMITGANINLDQSLPTTKIGKEYFITNALTYPDGLMEKMVIVATKDNTKVYLNDQKDPFTILNEGEYYIGPGPRFKYFQNSNQPSFTNIKKRVVETKGIYLKSSEPIYVFQMTGGFQDMAVKFEPDMTPSTSSMIFSFPLDINYLSDNPKVSNTVIIPSVDKLSKQQLDNRITIKTENGANIYVNGNKVSDEELSPIVGKDKWSFWSRFQQKGNLIISSDKSLNIDYTGGFQFSGLSGSFTGFSNDPFIIKNGNCIEETVILTLNNFDFDKIQWKLNGVDIIGANSSTYIPDKPGIYTCELTYMDFKYITDEIDIQNCFYTITSVDLGSSCSNFVISPVFSNPNQDLDIDKIEIITQPMNGKVTLDNNTLNFLPDKNFLGNDRFVYKITAKNGFYEVFKVSYSLLPQPIGNIKESLLPKNIVEKDNYYDLNAIINVKNNELFYFYESVDDAKNSINEILNSDNYISQSQKEIFVKIINTNGCVIIKSFLLKIQLQNDNDSNYNFFSPNGDGINDTWDLKGRELYDNATIKIFDRKGFTLAKGLVKDILPWNGRVNNLQLPSDTYWYVIEDNSRKIIKSGYVVLKNK